jgi:hypothetical protein
LEQSPLDRFFCSQHDQMPWQLETPPMSETTISVLIAITILIGLALFVPCVESFVGLCRRGSQRRQETVVQQDFGTNPTKDA